MTDQPAAPAAPDAPDAPEDAVPDPGARRREGGEETDARPGFARSRNQKVLAGVCGGAGRYFDVDPVIFRVVLVVLSLTGGIGLIVYGMGWLVIPQEDERQSEAHRLLSGRIEGAPMTAVLMALVGCGLYASTIGNGDNQAFSVLLLAGTTGAVYWSQRRRGTPEAVSPDMANAVADAPPAVQAPPDPGSSPSWWREPLTKEPAYLWGPDDGPYGQEDKIAWRERKKAARRAKGSWLFGFTVCLLAVVAAAVGVGASWQYQPAGTSLEIGLTAALGVLGAAFVLASFAGRARGGTVFLSLLTVAGLIGAATLPKSGHGLGSTTWRPQTPAAVQKLYQRGAGTGTLDLRGLSPAGGTVVTAVRIGAGEVVLRLPRDAVVVIDYNLGLGQVLLPGESDGHGHLGRHRHQVLTYRPPAGTASAGTVDLDVDLTVGQLKVIR
ncbi:phage shock protein C (PspC) family protein [Streptomyces sp. DvalAA-14]|uniref:PspC domain-containing protein n=1 Tax=unclassified Streptomyces TaxID=2593676 RepID=UPI00081B2F47|nr:MULTISPECIES: PspC domain-containing protein [unclassified Streptomyces]MYS19408.1 PspC domain-containing protein [Streptomyces sp. SID4948]SCD43748.1 phage shock protein C (PspC) family protein [Streptomyces sp. DvalAA-14]